MQKSRKSQKKPPPAKKVAAKARALAQAKQAVNLVTAPGARGRDLRKRIKLAFKKANNPLTSQAIHAWRTSGRVPQSRVAVVAELLGMKEKQVRPDLF